MQCIVVLGARQLPDEDNLIHSQVSLLPPHAYLLTMLDQSVVSSPDCPVGSISR